MAPARTHYTPYYLHSQGQANSLRGDGRLDPVVPARNLPIALSTIRMTLFPRVAATR